MICLIRRLIVTLGLFTMLLMGCGSESDPADTSLEVLEEEEGEPAAMLTPSDGAAPPPSGDLPFGNVPSKDTQWPTVGTTLRELAVEFTAIADPKIPLHERRRAFYNLAHQRGASVSRGTAEVYLHTTIDPTRIALPAGARLKSYFYSPFIDAWEATVHVPATADRVLALMRDENGHSIAGVRELVLVQHLIGDPPTAWEYWFDQAELAGDLTEFRDVMEELYPGRLLVTAHLVERVDPGETLECYALPHCASPAGAYPNGWTGAGATAGNLADLWLHPGTVVLLAQDSAIRFVDVAPQPGHF